MLIAFAEMELHRCDDTLAVFELMLDAAPVIRHADVNHPLNGSCESQPATEAESDRSDFAGHFGQRAQTLSRRADVGNPWAKFEPRISANLRNQFEWPLLFYVACLLLIQQGATGRVAVALAWIFVGDRLLHSVVQILTTNVRLRGLVFMVNFLAVPGLWMLVVQSSMASG